MRRETVYILGEFLTKIHSEIDSEIRNYFGFGHELGFYKKNFTVFELIKRQEEVKKEIELFIVKSLKELDTELDGEE